MFYRGLAPLIFDLGDLKGFLCVFRFEMRPTKQVIKLCCLWLQNESEGI